MTFDELLFGSFEMVLIGSFEYALIDNDIQNTQHSVKKESKKNWRDKWLEQYNKYIKEISEHNVYNEVITNSQELNRTVEYFQKDQFFDRKARLIILELVGFTPYYPLSESEQKKWKNLKINSDAWKTKLNNIATKLRLNRDLPRYYSECFKSALNNISGKKQSQKQKIAVGALAGGLATAVTGGLAATAIAPFFAASGLSGAAAISSGLATLGGGAIATGGFGMAGGFAVIVGGGAILGSAGGGLGGLGIDSLIKNPNLVLYECAKIEVYAKEILIRELKEFDQAEEVIESLKTKIRELEDKLDNMRRKSTYKNNNSEEPFSEGEVKKVITYLSRVKERIKSFLDSYK